MLGQRSWRDIGGYFDKIFPDNKKNYKQLKERWIKHLDPNSKKMNWDIVEEYLFFESRLKLGNRWAPIAKIIPSKSDNDIKNHFHSNLKKMFRKLLKKKLDITCIYEKIRALYIFNYIKTKYIEIINYYDKINNTINFDLMKEKQTDLITNVDDRAICDLVIEQKGSVELLNKSINEVCLMMITDPITIKLIDGLKNKHLSHNIKNITINEINYEETEYYNLMNLIIKLHVYENLKENIGDNLIQTQTSNDSNITDKNIIQNIKSSSLFNNNDNYKNNNFTNNNSSQNKLESLPKYHKITGNDNNINGFYFQNSKDSEIYGLRRSFNICELNNNKENNNFLNDLKSNKYMELNLQNFNQYDYLKDINNVKNYKNKFQKENLNTETINDSSSDYKKKQNTNLKNEENFTLNENFNKKENDKFDDFITNTNKEMYYLKNNENEYKNYNNIINKETNVDNYYNLDDSLQVIDYDDLIEKFLESEELKCLIESEIPLDNNNNKIENKINPSIVIDKKIKDLNNHKRLNSDKLFNKKNKKILLEKLTNFQIAENNNITIINKIINSENKEYYINNNCYNINSENKSSVFFESLFNDFKSNRNFQAKSKNEIFHKNNHNDNFNENKNTNVNYDNNKFYNQNSFRNQEIFHKSKNNFRNNEEVKNMHSYKQCNGNSEIIKINNKIINCNNYNINNSQKSKEMDYNHNYNFMKDNSNISNIINNSNNKYSSFNSNSDYKKSIFKIIKNPENNLNENIKLNSNKNGNIEANFSKKEQGNKNNTNDFINYENKTNSVKTVSNNNEDIRIKYTSIEDENLINTNCCFISNNLLDRLMNLKDPNLFLNIIEKIIVNNIVYSILGKDKYTSSTKLNYNNNMNQSMIKDNKENDLNNAFMKIEKELNNNVIIKSNNPSKEKQYNLGNKDILKSVKAIDKKNINNNHNNPNKIRTDLNLEGQKRLSEFDFEEETFYNIYNKIKDNHNINKIKIDDSNENNISLNLSLEEKDKINIEKFFRNSNNKKNNEDFDIANMNINKGNMFTGFSEKNINEDYIKNFISAKLDNDKKEEKYSRSNININNKNVISKFNTNTSDSNQQINGFENSYSKYDLGINNFNFHFHPRVNLLQRKKNHE